MRPGIDRMVRHRAAKPALRLGRVVCALWLVSVLAGSEARADYLVVNRRVTLRESPISGSEPVLQVEPGQVLPLADGDRVNRFYPVAFPEGRTSWVYQSFVARHEGNPPATDTGELGLLRVFIINVGQADAILIRCPDGEHEMLIDAGDTRYPGSADSFRQQLTLLQPDDDPIEVVIATHPHADHIGSMAWVLQEYQVDLYVDSGRNSTSTTFGNVEAQLALHSVPRAHVRESVPDVDFCPRADVSAIVLRPSGYGTLSDANDVSVVVRVDYGARSFLFVGDAEDHEEAQLLADPSTAGMLDCDFLKAGHHGSDTSSTPEFLWAVTPELVVISSGAPGVGTNVGYKHPRLGTVDELLNFVRGDPGIRALPAYDADAKRWTLRGLEQALYCTALDGDLVFVCDGHTIELESRP